MRSNDHSWNPSLCLPQILTAFVKPIYRQEKYNRCVRSILYWTKTTPILLFVPFLPPTSSAGSKLWPASLSKPSFYSCFRNWVISLYNFWILFVCLVPEFWSSLLYCSGFPPPSASLIGLPFGIVKFLLGSLFTFLEATYCTLSGSPDTMPCLPSQHYYVTHSDSILFSAQGFTFIILFSPDKPV